MPRRHHHPAERRQRSAAPRSRGSRSSPSTSSRLISRPTTKKKIAIRPSLTQCCSVSSSGSGPTSTARSVCQNASYDAAHGEFAQTSATAGGERAARSRRRPRCGGTRAPAGRAAAPAACCWRCRPDRSPRRRRGDGVRAGREIAGHAGRASFGGRRGTISAADTGRPDFPAHQRIQVQSAPLVGSRSSAPVVLRRTAPMATTRPG